ncbi:MAG TPA: DMT family transporter [Anaerolineales bacterium]
MPSTLIAAVFALSAAVVWGSGDFASGLVARRIGPFHALLISYAIGLFGLTILAITTAEPFSSLEDLGWGVLAGLFGMAGFLFMLRGFTVGRMGVVAAVSSLLASAIPVLVAALTIGLPRPVQLIGFLSAFVAIWLLSYRAENEQRPAGLGLAVLGGLGFGVFFTVMDQISSAALFWPLVASRLVACLLMAGFALASRRPLVPAGAPTRLLLLAGFFDVFGNLFFLLAIQSGRLDIAAVLVSLYPAVTVLLASVFIKERLTRLQVVGVGLAVLAIALISI